MIARYEQRNRIVSERGVLLVYEKSARPIFPARIRVASELSAFASPSWMRILFLRIIIQKVVKATLGYSPLDP